MNRPPVKQFCRSELTEGQIHFVVRLDHCGSLLSYFLELYAEAERDFPQLTPETVKAVHYGGDRISGYFGIEFTLNGVGPPEGYREISALEFTR
jgi:hypothetical protein